MDIKLPDGRILKNVPEGTTRAQIEAKLGPVDTPKPGFVDRVKADMGKRIDMYETIDAARASGEIGPAQSAFQKIGKVGVGAINDVVGEGIASGYRGLMSLAPENVKRGEKALGEAVAPVANKVSEAYGGFSQEYPNAARNIEAAANIASFIPIANAARPVFEKTGEATLKAANALDTKLGQIGTKKVRPINSEQMREIGGNLFQESERLGGVINPQAASGFIDDIVGKTKPKTNWEQAAKVKSEVDDIVGNLSQLRGQPMSLEAARGLDERIGELAYSPKNFAMGKFTPEGKQLLDIQHTLRDTIERAADSGMIAGGDAGVKAWREGQKVWSTSLRMRDLERIVENAQRAENPATAIKTGMRTLLRNANKTKGYTKQELAAIEHASRTGIVTDALRLAGSGLGPVIGGAVGGTVGGLTGGPVGAAAGAAAAAGPSYVIREGAKALAGARQTARAEKAIDVVRSRVFQQPAPVPLSKQIGAMLSKPQGYTASQEWKALAERLRSDALKKKAN